MEAIYENIGKISGINQGILRKRLLNQLSLFVKKLAILNPDVEMDTDIDNYKIVLNRNEAEEILQWIWLL
nr:hypothetical protein [Mycoplasmopsis bovis]